MLSITYHMHPSASQGYGSSRWWTGSHESYGRVSSVPLETITKLMDDQQGQQDVAKYQDQQTPSSPPLKKPTLLDTSSNELLRSPVELQSERRVPSTHGKRGKSPVDNRVEPKSSADQKRSHVDRDHEFQIPRKAARTILHSSSAETETKHVSDKSSSVQEISDGETPGSDVRRAIGDVHLPAAAESMCEDKLLHGVAMNYMLRCLNNEETKVVESYWSIKSHTVERSLPDGIRRLYVPVLHEAHWSIIIIHMNDKRVVHLNSFETTPTRREHVKELIELRRRSGVLRLDNDYRWFDLVPYRRRNMYDCGPVAILNAIAYELGYLRDQKLPRPWNVGLSRRCMLWILSSMAVGGTQVNEQETGGALLVPHRIRLHDLQDANQIWHILDELQSRVELERERLERLGQKLGRGMTIWQSGSEVFFCKQRVRTSFQQFAQEVLKVPTELAWEKMQNTKRDRNSDMELRSQDLTALQFSKEQLSKYIQQLRERIGKDFDAQEKQVTQLDQGLDECKSQLCEWRSSLISWKRLSKHEPPSDESCSVLELNADCQQRLKPMIDRIVEASHRSPHSLLPSGRREGVQPECLTPLQSLQNRAPINIPKLKERVLQWSKENRNKAKKGSWGRLGLAQDVNLRGKARPARIYVPGIPPDNWSGEHEVTTRDQADVLCLDDETASLELEDGPRDGKIVLIRKSTDVLDIGPDQIFSIISRFWTKPIPTQLPSITSSGPSARDLSSEQVAEIFKKALDGKTKVGYAKGQSEPHNIAWKMTQH